MNNADIKEKEKSKRMQLYANQPADNREYRFLPGCKQEQ